MYIRKTNDKCDSISINEVVPINSSIIVIVQYVVVEYDDRRIQAYFAKMFAQILKYLRSLIYGIMKSIYRWLTGTCELQRICKSCNETGDKTTAVEKSLGCSKTEVNLRYTITAKNG